jgi:cytochrome c-type biogenesis protein CcmH
MKRLIFTLMLIASPLWAVEPDEILADPVLETRAREISKGLRCLVCQNESIDESHASLARDLRILVRERLVAGDDDQVVDFIVERYGEYVLLQPRASGSTLLLWAAGPLMLLLAAGSGIIYLRGRSSAAEQGNDALSEAEEVRLREILSNNSKE